MRSKQPTAIALVWGAIGPLSVLFGGNIVMFTTKKSQQPYYRVFDPLEGRYRQMLRRRPIDRRPRHRRRTLVY